MSKYDITAVAPQLVNPIIPHVRGFLEKIIERTEGEISLDGLHHRCRTGAFRLWIVSEDAEHSILRGVIVTEIINYDAFKALRVVGLAGDHFEDWIEKADKLLVDIAQWYDCKRIEEVGRRGWAKRLAPFGYRQAYAWLVKEIA